MNATLAGSAPAPAPRPRAQAAYDSYAVEPEPVKRPKRAPARPPVAAPEPPARQAGLTLPIPALVGGAVGVALLSVLAAWGVGLFGGGTPQGDPAQPAVVTQDPAPGTPPAQPAQAEAAAGAAAGEVSVAAMLALEDPAPAQPAAAEPASQFGGESDVAAKARAGAAAVAASDVEGGKTLTTAEIVAESEPSVALIKGSGSSGTGFLIAPGLIATNAHVIDDEFASDLEVLFVSADDAHKDPIHAELLYEDPERDLAILAVPTDLKPLRIAKTYSFKKGEDVTVIGSPGMGNGQVLENAISRGVMSTKAQVDNKSFYQLNIAINPGNSGGPVFDSSGRVIGVVTLKSAKQEATGFCVPIEDLQTAIAKVGSQPTAEVEKTRSKHRTKTAVKALGGGGAILCLLLDLRNVDAQAKNPAVKEVLDRIETVADMLEKEVVPTLTTEGPLVRKDLALTSSVRGMIGEMLDNFTKLRTATANHKTLDDRQLRILKQNHRRLITGLSSSLKIEFPKDMMVAFEDHAPSQPAALTMLPSNLGAYGSRSPRPSNGINRSPSGSNRSSSIRERMQQRKNGR